MLYRFSLGAIFIGICSSTLFSVFLYSGYMQRTGEFIQKYPKTIIGAVGIVSGLALYRYYTQFNKKDVRQIEPKAGTTYTFDPFEYVMGIPESRFQRLKSAEREKFIDRDARVLKKSADSVLQLTLFQKLFGAKKDVLESPKQVPYGLFKIYTINDLASGLSTSRNNTAQITFNVLTRTRGGDKWLTDVSTLQADPKYAGAVFQVASNFNCLEGAGGDIGTYFYPSMFVQGEAAATGAMASLIYRFYFLKHKDSSNNTYTGQEQKQVNLLSHFDIPLSGGYPTYTGYTKIKRISGNIQKDKDDSWYKNIAVGVHAGAVPMFKRIQPLGYAQARAEIVTNKNQRITQVFTAAINLVGKQNVNDYELFARGCLRAAYEGALLVGIQQNKKQKREEERESDIQHKEKKQQVVLTLVGGGVFQNKLEWIIDAIRQSLKKYASYPLEVTLVIYEELKNVSQLDRIKDLVRTYKGSYTRDSILVEL